MQLREYQENDISRIRDSMRAGNKAVLYQLPTGGGKTIVATHPMRIADSRGRRAMFMAHRRELVHQASRKLHDAEVDHGVIMAGEMGMARQCQVASVQTLHSRWKSQGRLPEAELLIVDEAHHAKAATYQDIIDWYLKNGGYVLGITATPIRTDGKGLGDIFTDLVQGPSMLELQRLGFLVPTLYYSPSEVDLAKIKMTAGDYNQKSAQEVLNKPKLVGDVVDNWLNIASSRSTVVFATGVQHSIELCNQFRARGIAAEHVDGTTDNETRDSIMRRMDTGDVQVLTNCDVATEGWDCPVVSCAVIARPTKSAVKYIQMVGRVKRVLEGKEDSVILDHAGVYDEHGAAEEFTDWYLEQTTEAFHPNPQRVRREKLAAKPLKCPKCSARFTGRADCPSCGYQYKPPGKEVGYIDADLGLVPAEVVDSKDPKNWSNDIKRDWFLRLKGWCVERGKNEGAAAHAYKAKFGTWPGNAWKSMPHLPSSEETTSYMKHRMIKFAKSKARERMVQ